MFFIIAQKINNLLLKTNEIFNYKIGIVGFLFYLIIFIFIKLPILKQLNWNNWMLFILFVVFLLLDGLLLGYDYINTIKKLEKEKEKIQENFKQPNETVNTINNNDYETTTELETTITETK